MEVHHHPDLHYKKKNLFLCSFISYILVLIKTLGIISKHENQ